MFLSNIRVGLPIKEQNETLEKIPRFNLLGPEFYI